VQKARDGEGIAVMRSNPALRHEVKLDLWLVEPEQVVDEHISVNGLGFSGMDAEGVELDDFGNPRAYWVLREHPNSIGATVFEPPQRVPAAQVLHYFSPERAGQWRGVSQIAPAIPLCAALRRYTLATVAAAENAANMTMALKSNAMGDADEHNEAAGDILPLEAGGVPLLPAGYELQGIKAEQPVSTYAEFKREVINEIARCLSMPFNVAAADSSSYNYASGRLDHQTYFKSIRVEQKRIIAQILDPLLAAFLREAVLIEGLFTPEVRSKIGRDGALPKHAWFFDGFEHVDPVKEANADDIRLQNGSATLSDLYAKTGQDWQQKVEQRAKELQFIGEMERKYNVVMREPAGARDDNAEPEDRDEPPASNGRGARSRAPARPGASAPGGRRREAAR
jgi:lambda family phage portal protein